MPWKCTQCGAIDLTTKTCPYCGARQAASASYPAQPPPAVPRQRSPIIELLAGIGYLLALILPLVTSLMGGGASNHVTQKSFDDMDDGELLFWAVLGVIEIGVLIFVVLMLLRRK